MSGGGLETIAMAVAHLEQQQAAPIPIMSSFVQQPRMVSEEAAAEAPEPTASSAAPESLTVSSTAALSDMNAQLQSIVMSLELRELDTVPVPDRHQDIAHVLGNDVISGRGGETNHHAGNVMYRAFVRACQPVYIEAKRRDKPAIAQRIVLAVRRLGGRFLKKEGNAWRDVGNVKAREKTSQALREGAPELRQGAPIVSASSKLVPTNIDTEALKRRLSLPLVTSGEGSEPGSPLAKKRRTSLKELAEIATSPRSLLDVQQPPCYTATISADDEDAFSPGPPSQTKLHGPRIKLLKQRLECSS